MSYSISFDNQLPSNRVIDREIAEPYAVLVACQFVEPA